uniref:Uncharacterized protein n=1 Tax=Sphaerodactylus townsendi TaxID=933632 RepID=A0ACB8EZM9_9SAUR
MKSSENLQFKINLIERLHDLNIEDANEVDWEVLSSIIGGVPQITSGGEILQAQGYSCSLLEPEDPSR